MNILFENKSFNYNDVELLYVELISLKTIIIVLYIIKMQLAIKIK